MKKISIYYCNKMPSHIRKHLHDDHFRTIASGEKTVEGRLRKGDFAGLDSGDLITFYNDSGEEITVVILAIIPYDTFDEMLEDHLQDALPKASNKEEGLKIYRNIYNEKDEERYKVYAIKFMKADGYLTPLPGSFNDFRS